MIRKTAGTGETSPELMAIVVAGTSAVTMKFGTSASAATGWSGTGTISNLSFEAGTETPATCSGTIVGTAALAAI